MSRNEFLIAENALQRVASTVPVGSRLVITGATGWLGRTLVSLLAGSQVELFLLGSRNRNFEFGLGIIFSSFSSGSSGFSRDRIISSN